MWELIFLIIMVFLACSFIFFGFDDLCLDMYYLFVARSRGQLRVSVKQLNVGRQQSIAIFLPAWGEATVIETMLETSIKLISYSIHKYTFFLGCYPNDQPTIQAVQRAALKFPNIQLVVNPKAGPTNKADNLNSIYNGLIQYETRLNTRFDIIVMQDAEDVIHPLSLRLFNYLIPPVDMLQLPVLPFEPPATIKGFFTHLTQGTYVDEFAENHLQAMVVRDQLRAFVPSAGVGTAIRRKVMDDMASTGNPFDIRQLTEDYEFALRLQSRGYKTHFFMEGVERLLPGGKLVKERIAIREMFPNTYRTAVKQKSRWTYGITFQAHRTSRAKPRNWRDAYTIYRDAKSRWANLILGPGYVVLLFTISITVYYFLTDTFPDHDPSLTEAWEAFFYLSVITTALALEREFMRGLAVGELYGIKQAIMAVFVPPLLPIRMLWGNIINFSATMSAWRLFLFGSSTQRKKWAKTEHRVYASERFLKAYRRSLGDLTLQNKIITPRQLRSLLKIQKRTGKPLGKILLEENIVDEDTYAQLLSQHFNLDYLNLTMDTVDPSLAKLIPYNLAYTFRIVPLTASRTTIVIASPEPLAFKTVDALTEVTKRQVIQVLSPSSAVDKALKIIYSGTTMTVPTRLGRKLLQARLIDESQLLEALRIGENTGRRLGDILVSLHYIEREEIERMMS